MNSSSQSPNPQQISSVRPANAKDRSVSPFGKMLTSLGLAVALLVASTVVAPVEASAHTNGHSTCITTAKTGTWNVQLNAKNDCGHTINIKFQMSFARDSACYRVPAGASLVRNVRWGSARGKGVPC